MARKAKPAAGRAPAGLKGIREWRQVGLDELRGMEPHPENVRDHPPEQADQTAESLARHGWVKPLVFNEATGYLVDGHLRRDLALAGRAPVPVPVVVGSWEAEDHEELLALLDFIGEQAEVNFDRFEALRAKLSGRLAAGSALAGLQDKIQALRERMASAPVDLGGLFAASRPGADGDDEDEPDPELDVDDGDGDPFVRAAAEAGPGLDLGPVDHVRMVQLFLSASTIGPFNERIATLRAAYGTPNTTETVMECVRREAERAAAERETGE